jgi:hypothetical protein
MNETVLAHPTYSNVYLNRTVYQLTGNVTAFATVAAVMTKVVAIVTLWDQDVTMVDVTLLMKNVMVSTTVEITRMKSTVNALLIACSGVPWDFV